MTTSESDYAFISYAHADEAFVQTLVKTLQAAGITCWYDRHLLPGDRWQAELEAQLAGCRWFIVVITPASMASEWCQWELHRAYQAQKALVPILRKKTPNLPKALGEIQYLNAQRFDDAQKATLIERLQRDEKFKSPPPAAAPPTTPPLPVHEMRGISQAMHAPSSLNPIQIVGSVGTLYVGGPPPTPEPPSLKPLLPAKGPKSWRDVQTWQLREWRIALGTFAGGIGAIALVIVLLLRDGDTPERRNPAEQPTPTATVSTLPQMPTTPAPATDTTLPATTTATHAPPILPGPSTTGGLRLVLERTADWFVLYVPPDNNFPLDLSALALVVDGQRYALNVYPTFSDELANVREPACFVLRTDNAVPRAPTTDCLALNPQQQVFDVVTPAFWYNANVASIIPLTAMDGTTQLGRCATAARCTLGQP